MRPKSELPALTLVIVCADVGGCVPRYAGAEGGGEGVPGPQVEGHRVPHDRPRQSGSHTHTG